MGKRQAPDTKSPRKDAESAKGLSSELLCEKTGYTDRRLRQIADKGYFRPPVRGRYGLDAVWGMIRYLKEENGRKNDSVKATEHRLKTAKAEIAEEELAILREKYVEKAAIGPALRNVSLHQRALLQRKLEGELPGKCANKRTLEILELNKAAVDEICGIFSDAVAQWVLTTDEHGLTRMGEEELPRHLAVGHHAEERKDNSRSPIANSQKKKAVE